MKILAGLLFVAMILGTSGIAFSQADKEAHVVTCQSLSKGNIRLFVDIETKDKNNGFESVFRRELRGLHDVDIIYDKQEADLGVTVLLIETRNKANVITGYAGTINVVKGGLETGRDRWAAASPFKEAERS